MERQKSKGLKHKQKIQIFSKCFDFVSASFKMLATIVCRLPGFVRLSKIAWKLISRLFL